MPSTSFRPVRLLVPALVVLTHELGHARGLGHVADPDAAMAASYRQDDVPLPVALSDADVAALMARCGPGR